MFGSRDEILKDRSFQLPPVPFQEEDIDKDTDASLKTIKPEDAADVEATLKRVEKLTNEAEKEDRPIFDAKDQLLILTKKEREQKQRLKQEAREKEAEDSETYPFADTTTGPM